MSWLFGQTWIWYLIAFVVGVLLAWLLFVLPAQRRARSRAAAPTADGARRERDGSSADTTADTTADADASRTGRLGAAAAGAAAVGAAGAAAVAARRSGDDGGANDDAGTAARSDNTPTEQIPAVDPALSTLDRERTGFRVADASASDATTEIPVVSASEPTTEIPVTRADDESTGTAATWAAGAGAAGAAGVAAVRGQDDAGTDTSTTDEPTATFPATGSTDAGTASPVKDARTDDASRGSGLGGAALGAAGAGAAALGVAGLAKNRTADDTAADRDGHEDATQDASATDDTGTVVHPADDATSTFPVVDAPTDAERTGDESSTGPSLGGAALGAAGAGAAALGVASLAKNRTADDTAADTDGHEESTQDVRGTDDGTDDGATTVVDPADDATSAFPVAGAPGDPGIVDAGDESARASTAADPAVPAETTTDVETGSGPGVGGAALGAAGAGAAALGVAAVAGGRADDDEGATSAPESTSSATADSTEDVATAGGSADGAFSTGQHDDTRAADEAPTGSGVDGAGAVGHGLVGPAGDRDDRHAAAGPADVDEGATTVGDTAGDAGPTGQDDPTGDEADASPSGTGPGGVALGAAGVGAAALGAAALSGRGQQDGQAGGGPDAGRHASAEPAAPGAGAEPDQADVPSGRHALSADAGEHDGPYGPGSAHPNEDGSAPGPEFTVKGNADSMLYHSPESPYFARTTAGAWFSSAAAAEAAGFAAWFRRRAGAARPDTAAPADSAAPAESQVEPGEHAGSARPAADGSAPHPDYTVKANADSRRYHTPDSPYFVRTRATVWFLSVDDAEAAGFAPWRRN